MMTEEELEAEQPTAHTALAKHVAGLTTQTFILSGPDHTPPSKELTLTEKKELGLSKAGITDDVVFSVAYAGLTAVRRVEEFDAQGNVKMVERPDHIIRHKYLDSILRVKGYIRPDASVDATVNFNLTVTERDAIRTRLKKVIDI